MLNLPHAPATVRNREPIFSVLKEYIQTKNALLEIASGTGEHAAWLAPQWSHIQWQPSDAQSRALSIIDAYNSNNNNVLPAIQLDVLEQWPNRKYDVILCINMIHISPWSCCLALLQNAAKHLNPDGILYLYGPYKKNGQHTAISNDHFDHSLRQQNSNWGIRDLEEVLKEATQCGLSFQECIAMPANNFSLIFTC